MSRNLIRNICIFVPAGLYLLFFFPICEAATRLATKLLGMF
jgi:hypothetical protein